MLENKRDTHKRLVTQLWIGDENGYITHSEPSVRRYAKYCNADYIKYTTQPKKKDYPKTAHWAKLDIIEWFSEQTEYEEMLYLDADIILSPRIIHCENIDLFDRIQWGNPYFGSVVDAGNPFKSDTMVDAAKEEGWNFNNHKSGAIHLPPWDIKQRYFNTGLFLLNRQAAQLLISESKKLWPPKDIGLYEQTYINLCVDNLDDKLHIDWIGGFEGCYWNWLSQEFPQALLDKGVYHFVGDHKDKMEKYNEFFEKYRELVEC